MRRRAILGIGSNLGNRIVNFNDALIQLKSFGKISATSYLYETAPMYETKQPSFLNGAVILETELSPEILLHKIREIELSLGRSADLKKVWKGPRPIDIDILFYDNEMFESKELVIPHQSIQERDFVLKPLVDLEPEFIHPRLRKSLKEINMENDKTNPNLSYPERVWSMSNPLTNEEVTFNFNKETVGMGILNCTSDSFSLPQEARGADINYNYLERKANEFFSHGFKILDLGGESTSPGAAVVSPEIEASRILSFIEKIKQNEKLKNLLISIDTRKSYVAEKGINAGAAIINDVSGGSYDDKMIDLIAEKNIPYVIMHSRGTPQNMTKFNSYSNLIEEVVQELKQRVNLALSKGVYKWNIWIDPGIGFAKNREQNIEIFKNLDVISKELPYPLLLGYSSKKFIQEITGEENTVYGNSSLASIAIQKGASVLRVHDANMSKSILFADSVYKNRQIYSPIKK